MKKLGRKHRHYFRIVAIDGRQPRDGRVIEELGTYDPMVKNTDERVTLRPSRIKYWLSVGALPSENVAVLFKKYMTKWEELEAQGITQIPRSPAAPPPVATPAPAPAAEAATEGAAPAAPPA
jgi:small subunit ribosomal protein S16